MVRLVLFDIDGTLVETGGAGVKAFSKICETEFGVPNGSAGLRFAGRTDPSIVREFFLKYNIPATQENFARFFQRYLLKLEELMAVSTGRVLPGMRELIRELQDISNPPLLGLLTGNIRQGAQIKLSHYGLWEHFKVGAFGDDHEDRDQIAHCARSRCMEHLQTSIPGEEILVIGDTPMDVQCGRAIGAKVLALATGSYNVEQLQACKPDWAVKDLTHWSYQAHCGNGLCSQHPKA